MDEQFKEAYESLEPNQQRIVCEMVLALSKQEHPLPEWITLKEAARILNVSVPTVRAKVAEGVIRSKRVSDRKTYARALDIENLRKAQLGL